MQYRLTTIMVLLIGLGVGNAQSFTIEEAVDYALTNSNSLKLKKIDIADAEANIRELRAIGLPKVSGSVGYTFYPAVPATPLEDFISPIVIDVLNSTVTSTDPIPYFPPTFFEFSFVQRNNLSGSLDANAILFDGSYLAALKAARLFRDFVDIGVEVTEQQIRNNVTEAYINVLVLEVNRATLNNNISNLEKTFAEMEVLYAEGFIEKLDVDRIELTLNNLKTEVNKLNQVENLSKNLLKFQMDYPVEEPIELSEDLETVVNKSKIDEVNLEEEFDISKRKEYNQILKGLELQQVDIDRIDKMKYPSLTAFANLGANLQRNNLFDNDEAGFLSQSAIGLNLAVPIYDGGDRKAKLERAKLSNEKALIELEDFERSVKLQVANARIQYINAKTTLTSTERSLEIIQGIYDKTAIKFREGVGSSVELTQAESQLFSAQADYINALYELLTAKTDLQIALGEI